MKKSILFTAVAGLLGTATVFAATGLGNPGQQGSLLIFPHIAIQDGQKTIVRITNNSEYPVRLKCFWVEQGTENVQAQFPEDYPDYKHYTDFALDLTRNQSVWFDAKTGYGSVNVAAFPDYGYNGELKCWAVNATESANLKWNYLSGTAEILNTDYNRKFTDTYKYNAYAFYLTKHQEADGILNLNYTPDVKMPYREYDACGEYLVQSFSPADSHIWLGYGYAYYLQNTLSWAGCEQNLVYESAPGVYEPGKAEWIDYRVEFDVFNADETKKTGAYELGDSVWEVDLAQVDRNDGKYFTYKGLGTHNGYFRAWEKNGYGLVGVLKTLVKFDGLDPGTHAVNTVQAGYSVNQIRYPQGLSYPESK